MLKNFLLKMLSDGSEISMKRVITLGAFMLLAIAFILDYFFKIELDPKLLSIMEGIVMFGFGSTVVEKFAPKPKVTEVPKTDEIPA